jgi:UDP-N-acetyl-D-glucosamine dehydrogenase
MPFYPGPGLGGHSIPIDPFYHSWKAKESGFEARFIELAGQINRSMPEHVISLAADALNGRSKSVRGSRVLLLGLAYKADIDDVRESPALDVLELLSRRGAEVSYHDPFVPRVSHDGRELATRELTPALLREQDLVVITTAHTPVDYDLVVEHAPLILDTRNVLRGRRKENIVRL